MELEGKVWKSKKHWLIEIPSLDVMTQGKSREDALEMIKDAIIELIRSYFKSEAGKDFDIAVNDYMKGVIGVTATNNKLLLALSLRRQREKSGSTVREAAERLGAKSPNAYAQYEKGKIRISLDQYEKLLQAANPYHHSLLRVV
jgi:predicted RNase H-like HicB family nuclease